MDRKPIKIAIIITLLCCSGRSVCQAPVFETVFGDTITEKPLAIRQVPSGSILMGGYAQSDSIGMVDFSLSKLDVNGNHLWTRYAGTVYDDFLGYMDHTADSTHFILTGSSGNGLGETDGRVIKLDTNANEIFSVSTGVPGSNDAFSCVDVTTDGGFITCGFTAGVTGTGLDYYIVKYDAGGTEQWQKIYGGSDNDYAQGIQQTPDGGYIVVGDSKSFNPFGNYDIWLLKLDAAGDTTWSALIGDPNHINGSQSVINTSDGNYLVVGETTIPPTTGFDFTLAKIDPTGTLQWLQLYGGAGTDAAFAITEITSGKFIVTGYSNSNTMGISPIDLVTLGIDANGNELGRQYYGGNSIDIGYDIQPSLNGNFLIAGLYKQTDDDYYALEIGGSAILTISGNSIPEPLNAYPNPTNGSIYINSMPDDPIQLYNTQGVLLIEQTSTSTGTELDLSGLASGIYVVRCGGRITRIQLTSL